MPEVTQSESRNAGSRTPCYLSSTRSVLARGWPGRHIWLRGLQRLGWRPEQEASWALRTCFFTSGHTISVLPQGGLFSGYESLISTFPKGPGTLEHKGSGTTAEQTEMPGEGRTVGIKTSEAAPSAHSPSLPSLLPWPGQFLKS